MTATDTNPTATTGGWSVFLWDENTVDYAVAAVDTYGWKEGASRTTVTPLPAAATQVTFDGLGRVVPNADATASLTRINITNASASARNLSIMISAVGGTTATKLCDPAVPAVPPDPRSCS